jgi:hypothetical protein
MIAQLQRSTLTPAERGTLKARLRNRFRHADPTPSHISLPLRLTACCATRPCIDLKQDDRFTQCLLACTLNHVAAFEASFEASLIHHTTSQGTGLLYKVCAASRARMTNGSPTISVTLGAEPGRRLWCRADCDAAVGEGRGSQSGPRRRGHPVARRGYERGHASAVSVRFFPSLALALTRSVCVGVDVCVGVLLCQFVEAIWA